MKNLLLILSLFVIGLQGYSQRILLGYKPSTSLPMLYRDTPRSINYAHPLFALNDTTAAIDTSGFTIASVVKNAAGDSVVMTMLNGKRFTWPTTGGANGTFSTYGMFTWTSPADSTTPFIVQANTHNAAATKYLSMMITDNNTQNGASLGFRSTNVVTNLVSIIRGGSSSVDLLLSDTAGTRKSSLFSLSSQGYDFGLSVASPTRPLFVMNLNPSGAYDGDGILMKDNTGNPATNSGITWYSVGGARNTARLSVQVGSGFVDNRMVFFTATSGGTLTEAARITSTQALLLGSTTNVANRIFDVGSTTKTSRPFPPMTAAQRTALTMAATNDGDHVYQTDGTKGVYVYKDGTGWVFGY